MNIHRIGAMSSILFLGIGFAPVSQSADVLLQNATATFSQADFWGAQNTIDGVAVGAVTSWAVNRPDGTSLAETIVWETRGDLSVNPATPLNFTLFHGDLVPVADHNLGKFRLSYTTDDRALFADGLNTGGDVSANWVVIDPDSFSSSTGETFTKLGDLSLLVSGGTNTNSTYTVGAAIAADGITGFRLEALEDPSLPFNGPGRQASNGNFHLSEFTVSTVPEPGAIWQLSLGLLVLFWLGKHRAGRQGARYSNNGSLA